MAEPRPGIIASNEIPQSARRSAAIATALPGVEPSLVVFGAHDPFVVERLDAIARPLATSIDLRTGSCWLEVPNGRRFLERLVSELGPDRTDIRVAFAPVDARLDDLIGRALLASDLAHLATALEREALAADPPEYDVHFQPVVDLSGGGVIGYESLIRASAAGVPIRTDDLIDRARRGGWLIELDQLGRTLALQGLGEGPASGLLFLNLMAPDGRFDLDAVRATVALAESQGLDADQIVFEASERHRYDLDIVTDQIAEMRALGVRLAIDDIGDGFASLLLVSRFQPDVMKIAGQLIDDLPSTEAKAVIRAVVNLAHETGAYVVAENVETARQAELLTDLDVDWGQGHLFGAPDAEVASWPSPLSAPAQHRTRDADSPH